MHRFFVDPSAFVGDRTILPAALAHQLQHVLRLHVGERVLLLDNAGWEYQAELTALEKRGAQARILVRQPVAGEPRTHVTLYQAVLKGPRFEWVLQKGTELGIAAFVPVITARCVAIPRDAGAKVARWQAIIREAAEQAGRGRIPLVGTPVTFAGACAQVDTENALIAWEEERGTSLRDVLDREGKEKASWSLFIGPEGGFTPEEIALAQGFHIRPVRLGPRILRAETAGMAMVAALFFALGEWS